MKEITLDCRGFVPRSELHRVFAEALSFPDHYGNNLDALHDCLTSLSEEIRLTLLNWDAAEEGLGRYAMGLKRVLTDAEEENPKLHIHYI
jgi:ribonuclease inhibitor